MQALFYLTIAYHFGDEAVRLLDLKDSNQHDWVGFAATNYSSSSPVRTEPASLLLLPPEASCDWTTHRPARISSQCDTWGLALAR